MMKVSVCVCVCVFVQVSNLQRENKEQINLIKKTNQEHKLELENTKKKNQVTGCGRREGERMWLGGGD